MRQVTNLLLTGILVAFGCEERNISPTIENFRLTKILNFSKSTSSQPNGAVEFSYDNNGYLIKESTINYPNTITTYKLYEYSGNQVTKKKIFDGQVGNLTLGTYIKYYYSGDKVTKEELFLSDGTLKYTTFYEFDGDKLINTYKVDDNLGKHHQYKYTFDNFNRLTLEEVFMYNQELSEFTKYFYDNSNRLVRTELYDHNRTLTSHQERIYSGTSKLANEELFFDPSGTLTQKRQLTYDNWENLTQINADYLGTTCSLFRRKYEGKLLIEEITFLPSFGCAEWTVTRYEYEKK